ncbi:uncharacterized protein LOC118192636 [Stegodyphus dumicola]|uniref:uncharacterized protein LOC118192636 n=1 Tax=Stegodyphus dumicola TaxID=202533 RepID=UPI0015A797EE|nr:uncharacterized protein LOC118192636 [Stegodyphus dumicola]
MLSWPLCCSGLAQKTNFLKDSRFQREYEKAHKGYLHKERNVFVEYFLQMAWFTLHMRKTTMQSTRLLGIENSSNVWYSASESLAHGWGSFMDGRGTEIDVMKIIVLRKVALRTSIIAGLLLHGGVEWKERERVPPPKYGYDGR